MYPYPTFLISIGHAGELPFTIRTDINRRVVLKTPFHKAINDRFAQYSSVMKLQEVQSRKGEEAAGGKNRYLPPSQQKKKMKDVSAKKIFNRYPIFALNLTCSPREYDITFDPAKTLVEFRVIKISTRTAARIHQD